MDSQHSELYKRLEERYASGRVPWDDALPPPEVVNYLKDHQPGRALDLGCGYGRASIYMAGLGWEVDAIDFIPEAIRVARERADQAGVQVHFHVAQVIDLAFLDGPYDFALDVGCGHNLSQEDLKRYRDQLVRLLRPGSDFLFFARMQTDNQDYIADGPSGLNEAVLNEIFNQGFALVWIDRSITKVEEQPAWASAWFRFRRL